MDEVHRLNRRTVQTRFQTDRLSWQTLALVYQRIDDESIVEESQDDGFQEEVVIAAPLASVVELMS